jgi:hypothetical protein
MTDFRSRQRHIGPPPAGNFTEAQLNAVFTPDVRRALPLARPRNATSRAIDRMTDTKFLPGRFVHKEGVSCARKRISFVTNVG